ncbi:HlyD family type I secretion periplasmic adaptor subunit [Hydrogenophaga sp.]|uniref:HlyD family type I secretion periplasmic adaptor subunit n=1 Tax=Hydrogenophaga sp. TaxID=1904254 RepID=UPI00262941F4|nr:HlyD family type I secretion periplasmic adaptor subunit [Hydrogenophaga sp.]MCW5655723.1 HlyD family type I secretion periplasmic adaptor subunit [Hydrogenophaga sp.]
MNLFPRFRAWMELVMKYVARFSYFWGQRHTLKTGFFNQDEAEFLPARLALQEAPASAGLRWSGRILMALVLVALLWAILGKVDIIVSATGRIIPSSRTKTIGSVDVASVRALHVTEGQRVKAGDVLIELDSSASDAENDKAAEAVTQARLQVARSQAMVHAVEQMRPPTLPPVPELSTEARQAAALQLRAHFEDFRARLERLEGEIARYSEAMPLATRRADDLKSLLEGNTVSHHAWLEAEQSRLDTAGRLLDARNQRAALIAQTRKDALDAMTEGNHIIAAARQDQRRAQAHSRLLKLTAPVDGTVQQLTVHTVGGVVPAAQPLMQIVPLDNAVEVEALVDNKDIGFVSEGQAAAVKVEAFDYTKYGTIASTVRHVSQDAVQDETRGPVYTARVVLDQSTIAIEGKSMPLSAGLSVQVDIKTGKRRVIEYVLSPVMRHTREALHER